MDKVTRAHGADAAPTNRVSPVNSHNEWDPLEEVIVGRLEGAVIPSDHPVVTCNIPGMAAQAQALFGAVFRDWLQARLEAPPPGVRRALRRRSYDDEGPIGRLERAAWTLADWRDFTAPWDAGTFDQASRVDALVEEVFRFAALTDTRADAQDPLFLDTEPARRFAAEVRLSEQVRPRDCDAAGLCAPGVRRRWKA